MSAKHSKRIDDYITSLYNEQPAGFIFGLNDFISSSEYFVCAMQDLGIECVHYSYWQHLAKLDRERLIDNAKADNENIYETTITTDDDVVAIYFLGENVNALLKDLKERWQSLLRSDI
jgi:hypothetical protein